MFREAGGLYGAGAGPQQLATIIAVAIVSILMIMYEKYIG